MADRPLLIDLQQMMGSELHPAQAKRLRRTGHIIRIVHTWPHVYMSAAEWERVRNDADLLARIKAQFEQTF